MSTSLLYHGFGVRGYEYARTQYEGGAVTFTLHQQPERLTCSACGSAQVSPQG